MSALISRSSSAAVSYVQHRATLDFVYPPPPVTRSGTLKVFMNFTQSAWPSRDRLKHPSRSAARESAPHCNTTAPGLYVSMTFCITDLKMARNPSSSMPSCNGTFTL